MRRLFISSIVALAVLITGNIAAASGEQFTPNDRYFELQWNLDAPVRAAGQSVISPIDDPDADIDMPEAWSLWESRQTTDPVYVGLIGTAIPEHEDLKSRLIQPGEDIDHDGRITPADFNRIDDDGNGYMDDVTGWDFDCPPQGGSPSKSALSAGVIAADANNGKGTAGIHGLHSPLRLISAVIYNICDWYPWSDDDQAAEALNYFADLKLNRGVNVVAVEVDLTSRYSLGTYLMEGIRHARDAGILVVAPAGNDCSLNRDIEDFLFGDCEPDSDVNPLYPASFDSDNIIAVAATDRKGLLLNSSHFGATSVDVAAPGFDIFGPCYCLTLRGNDYGWASGTYAATPQVTGLAALLWSYDPSLRFDDPDPDGDGSLFGKPSYLKIKERILNTVVKDPSLEGKTVSGGRINAWRALANRTDIDP